jgi:hypothetical protein
MQGKLSVWFRAGAARSRQSGGKNGSRLELFFRWHDGNAWLWRFHGIFEGVAHSGTNLIGACLRTSGVSGLKRQDDNGYPEKFHDSRCAARGRHFAGGGTKWSCDRRRTARRWRGWWQSREYGTTRTGRVPRVVVRRPWEGPPTACSDSWRREGLRTHVPVNEGQASQTAGNQAAASPLRSSNWPRSNPGLPSLSRRLLFAF